MMRVSKEESIAIMKSRSRICRSASTRPSFWGRGTLDGLKNFIWGRDMNMVTGKWIVEFLSILPFFAVALYGRIHINAEA